jgi:hypothetical protein
MHVLFYFYISISLLVYCYDVLFAVTSDISPSPFRDSVSIQREIVAHKRSFIIDDPTLQDPSVLYPCHRSHSAENNEERYNNRFDIALSLWTVRTEGFARASRTLQYVRLSLCQMSQIPRQRLYFLFESHRGSNRSVEAVDDQILRRCLR